MYIYCLSLSFGINDALQICHFSNSLSLICSILFPFAALTIAFQWRAFQRPAIENLQKNSSHIENVCKNSSYWEIFKKWDYPNNEARIEHWVLRWRHNIPLELREPWRSSCHHHLRPETWESTVIFRIRLRILRSRDLESWGNANQTYCQNAKTFI